MTAKDCKAWMQEQGIWKHWLLPVDGPNDKFDITGDWRDAYPPGNTPTYMPWDVGLNKDIADSVDLHCLLTSHLPDTDESKFSISTPKRGTRAYLRCLEGAPTPKRINRDCRFFVDTALSIFESKGALTDGLGSRNYRSGTFVVVSTNSCLCLYSIYEFVVQFASIYDYSNRLYNHL